MKRLQQAYIERDLEKKMVFLVGPRQVGKTWLAKNIASQVKNAIYLNYDSIEDRRIIQQQAWQPSTPLLILDECHKMPDWKNFLKGLYDTKPPQLKILVTGSARLDLIRQVGDSLAGRFFLHRLLPLSPSELHQLNKPCSLDHFLERGGFPEPFLAKNDIDANRWRNQYVDSLLREEIFDIANIQNMRAIKLVFELLRTKVGSPVSYQSIAEDVNISINTVKRYLELFEALYLVFTVRPFSRNIARSLLKEPKIYFYDVGMVRGDQGAVLENLVAVCLLKHVYSKVDYEGEQYKLCYLRTKDKQEVDFALVHEDSCEKIIEVKTTGRQLSKSLKWFHQKYGLPAIQVSKMLKHPYTQAGINVTSVSDFLMQLEL